MIRDLKFNAEGATLIPENYKTIEVSVVDADIEKILDQIPLEEIITHYGEEELVNKMGITYALAPFYVEDIINECGVEDILENIDESEIRSYLSKKG